MPVARLHISQVNDQKFGRIHVLNDARGVKVVVLEQATRHVLTAMRLFSDVPLGVDE